MKLVAIANPNDGAVARAVADRLIARDDLRVVYARSHNHAVELKEREGAVLVRVAETPMATDGPWPGLETPWDAYIHPCEPAYRDWLVDCLGEFWATGKLPENAGDPPA